MNRSAHVGPLPSSSFPQAGASRPVPRHRQPTCASARRLPPAGRSGPSVRLRGAQAHAAAILRSAADDEDRIEKLPVTSGPIIPAREQLGGCWSNRATSRPHPGHSRLHWSMGLVGEERCWEPLRSRIPMRSLINGKSANFQECHLAVERALLFLERSSLSTSRTRRGWDEPTKAGCRFPSRRIPNPKGI